MCQSDIRICPSVEITQIVDDSFRELSIKEGERIRRAGENSAVELAVIDKSVPIHTRWTSSGVYSINKQNLQLLARDVVKRDLQDVLLSGMFVNQEQIYTRLKLNGSLASDLSLLNNWQDCRIIALVHSAIRQTVRELL